MLEEVILRLEGLGYVYREEDKEAIEFSLQSVESYIANSCNLSYVPEGLKFVAVDMCCGEFLKAMRECGNLESFDISPTVKTIKEGDTSVTYSDEGEYSVDRLIQHLLRDREAELASYRVLKW